MIQPGKPLTPEVIELSTDESSDSVLHHSSNKSRKRKQKISSSDDSNDEVTHVKRKRKKCEFIDDEAKESKDEGGSNTRMCSPVRRMFEINVPRTPIGQRESREDVDAYFDDGIRELRERYMEEFHGSDSPKSEVSNTSNKYQDSFIDNEEYDLLDYGNSDPAPSPLHRQESDDDVVEDCA